MELENIAEGWFNAARSALRLLPKEIKELADKRLKICSECPQRNNNKCGICGCPLIAKTKSKNTHCPNNLW